MTPMQEVARRHRSQDMLMRGTYGHVDPRSGSWVGCSVGCFAIELTGELRPESSVHAIVAEGYGVPVWLVRVQDSVFEGVPEGRSVNWHVDLADACAAVDDWDAALIRVVVGALSMVAEVAPSALVSEALRICREGRDWPSVQAELESAVPLPSSFSGMLSSTLQDYVASWGAIALLPGADPRSVSLCLWYVFKTMRRHGPRSDSEGIWEKIGSTVLDALHGRPKS